MSQDTLYISPEYNPHSLQRDWGFLLCKEHRENIRIPHAYESLCVFRQRRYAAIVNQVTSCMNAWHPWHRMPNNPENMAAKVTTQAIAANSADLYHDVGLDIMTLALLADVPIHRPLHLTQNSLIGHWRWLRDVWRAGLTRPQCDTPAQTRNAVTQALQNGKNNLAIAQLRALFKKTRQASDDAGLYISFLNSLSLFCPFIATELLWRQGQIDHDPANRFGTKGNKGIVE